MSREIKFRAWDKKAKAYVGDTQLGFSLYEIALSPFEHADKLKELEFEQYTGSKDQYGKEIAEGDIIKIAENIAGYVIQDANGQWVIFCDNKECVKGNVTLGDLSKIPKLDLGNTLAKEYCSIVGNIRENPELFKK